MKHKKRILIIDDSKDILEAIQLLLEDAGYAVIAIDSGEYIDHLDSNYLPDLILLDLLLSGQNGGQVIQKLKNNDKTKNIPIILNSAHPNAKNIWKELGADDFIAKPFDIDILLTTVKKYIR